MGGRRFLGFGAVALAVALIAGCNGGSDDPTTSAPVSVEPTVDATTPEVVTVESTDDPTPDPTPTDPWALGPPAVTLDMQYDNEEGAVAFVEFYIDLTDYSYNHLDTVDVAKYSDVNCVGCQATIDSVAVLQEGGYTVTSGRTTVDGVIRNEYFPIDEAYIIEMEHTFGAVEVLDSHGNTVRSDPASTGTISYIVQYKAPYDWTMIAMGLTSSVPNPEATP